MQIEEVTLTEAIAKQLISLSDDWEREGSCHGYRKNTLEDLKGNRIFLAVENDITIGYLFGHEEVAEQKTSVCPECTSL